jgi:hypothetical protein
MIGATMNQPVDEATPRRSYVKIVMVLLVSLRLAMAITSPVVRWAALPVFIGLAVSIIREPPRPRHRVNWSRVMKVLFVGDCWESDGPVRWWQFWGNPIDQGALRAMVKPVVWGMACCAWWLLAVTGEGPRIVGVLILCYFFARQAVYTGVRVRWGTEGFYALEALEVAALGAISVRDHHRNEQAAQQALVTKAVVAALAQQNVTNGLRGQ